MSAFELCHGRRRHSHAPSTRLLVRHPAPPLAPHPELPFQAPAAIGCCSPRKSSCPINGHTMFHAKVDTVAQVSPAPAGLTADFQSRLARVCSAGFQTCCIADFQIGSPSASLRPFNSRSLGGFGNPRYSRLGSLRYIAAAQYALLHFHSSARAHSPALTGLFLM